MTSPKLMLTIVTGGILLGTLVGQMAHPVMKFADGHESRSHREAQFSSSPMQFVDAGPQDLSPPGWYGPVYAQPAVFAPQYAAIPEYSLPPESDRYLAEDDPEPYVAPEVDQASAEAAATARVLIDSRPASPARPVARSAEGSDTVPSDVAPDLGSDSALADSIS
ncbi:MAG: hypothetical protein ABIQ81_07390 [Novosphingobium sp.]